MMTENCSITDSQANSTPRQRAMIAQYERLTCEWELRLQEVRSHCVEAPSFALTVLSDHVTVNILQTLMGMRWQLPEHYAAVSDSNNNGDKALTSGEDETGETNSER